MELLSLSVLAKLVVALAFGFAGAAKLADQPGTRDMLDQFGLPTALVRVTGVALPAAELLVAVAILAPASAWGASVAALALLGTFSAAIAINLARGRRPECNCFGQFTSAPIGAPTLLRNGVLAGCAYLVVEAGPGSAGSWAVAGLSGLSPAESAAAAAIAAGLTLLAAITFLLMTMLRRLTRLEQLLATEAGAPATLGNSHPRTPAGLPIGSRAPEFRLKNLWGAFVTLTDLRSHGRPLLLLFTSPTCPPCNTLMPDVAAWQQQHGGVFDVVALTRRSANAKWDVANILVQDDHEVSEAYECWGTPSAVLVRPDGTIGSLIAQGAPAIRSLVAFVLEEAGESATTVASPAARAGTGVMVAPASLVPETGTGT